ncbi:MAG: long-chain fatty acid--CoA ligase [Candidatus Nezhaarchaeales archaeon]|nr:MAG: long-chain fatty acid--CoA ligase [Candidatus Nezhaarchaeota archaeon WYZ-LMO8]
MSKMPDFVSKRIWLEKAWVKGVPADVEIPERPLHDVIDEACQKYQDRTAIVFYGAKISYKQLGYLIRCFATSLANIGVKKGDVVAIYAPNCPQFAIAYYGAMMAGATVTALSPLFVPREVEFQLNDSDSKYLVTVDVLYKNFAAVRKNTKIEKVIVASLLGEKIEGDFIDFNAMLKVQPNPPKIEWDVKEDIAVLQYTGGTTGLPKGCMLTHYNVVSQLYQMMPYNDVLMEWIRSHRVVREEGEYVILDFDGKEVKIFKDYYEKSYGARIALLPWYHIYGQTVDLSFGLTVGDVLVVFSRFEPDKILEAIEKYRVTTFMGAPAIFVYFANNPELVKKYDLSSLVYVNNGAGPIAPEIVEKWDELTSSSARGLLVEGYGLSEASPVTHTTFGPPFRKRKVGSIGPPLPNTYAAIINPETLEFIPIGAEGELIVSGPQVMKGYWKRPEETEKVFLYINGVKWLRTGDVAKMDEEGYFYIIDRLKDMIKYKGHSVYPREIEDVMYEHPAIQEVCVVGIPDPEAGETIKAFVVLRPEYRGKVTEQDIIAWCKERLAAYKYPRIIEFRSELPKSAAGKFLRRLLREEELKKLGLKK